jgi:hypothetical protein
LAQADSIVEGHKTLAASNTAEKLSTEAQVLTGLIVKAKATNTELIRIGGSGVGAESVYLEKKEWLAFDLLDPTKVYVYGHENDTVYWMGLAP